VRERFVPFERSVEDNPQAFDNLPLTDDVVQALRTEFLVVADVVGRVASSGRRCLEGRFSVTGEIVRLKHRLSDHRGLESS
jgi:hypothetical protein